MHLLSALALTAALLSGPPAYSEVAAPSARDLVAALEVVHDWDARREGAWRAEDSRALRRLYAPGSTAGAADVRLLRRYADRGLAVRRIVTQVLALHVLHLDARHLRVRLVDRVAGGLVGNRPLGTTRPVERVVALTRTGPAGEWRVVSVRPTDRH